MCHGQAFSEEHSATHVVEWLTLAGRSDAGLCSASPALPASIRRSASHDAACDAELSQALSVGVACSNTTDVAEDKLETFVVDQIGRILAGYLQGEDASWALVELDAALSWYRLVQQQGGAQCSSPGAGLSYLPPPYPLGPVVSGSCSNSSNPDGG